MQKRSFGKTKDGKEVFLFSMENKNGVKAEVTNYGAILVNLFVPDKNGNIEDVVLGFDDVTGYEANPSYFGSVIAPSANRIGGASFELNGETYTLKKNNGFWRSTPRRCTKSGCRNRWDLHPFGYQCEEAYPPRRSRPPPCPWRGSHAGSDLPPP